MKLHKSRDSYGFVARRRPDLERLGQAWSGLGRLGEACSGWSDSSDSEQSDDSPRRTGAPRRTGGRTARTGELATTKTRDVASVIYCLLPALIGGST